MLGFVFCTLFVLEFDTLVDTALLELFILELVKFVLALTVDVGFTLLFTETEDVTALEIDSVV